MLPSLVKDVLLLLATTSPFVYAHLYDQSPLGTVPESAWHKLNSTIGGRLIRGKPFSDPCFARKGESKREVFESSECVAVREHYLNEHQRSSLPGGYINTQWETCQTISRQCLLDSAERQNFNAVVSPRECDQGSIPEYFIPVQNDIDVSIAFAFSRKTGVPIVVKNTGHDYKGRSSAPGSLALWTHHLKNITHNPAFIPEGCIERTPYSAVTLGAGVQFQEIYDYAEKHNFTFVGGSDPGVGATGGWLLGGGHGALSNTMGLGVDRVLEFKVVTPDGRLRVANACKNQDLFFALRGGGGSTFGVVLEATSLISPPVTLQVTLVAIPTGNITLTEEFWRIIIENSLRWANEGYGAFVTAQSALYVTPILSKDEARRTMKPLVGYGNGLRDRGFEGVKVLELEFKSWGSFFNTFAGTESASIGISLALASRLVPKANFQNAQSREALLTSLLSAYKRTPGLRFLVSTPFGYPGDESTSVTEAWRDAVYHITLIASWNFNATREEKQQKYADVGESIGGLRRITPDGAYLNEADVHEPNHAFTFWGENYGKLLRIKEKYDPERLLDCWHCVGWNPDSWRFNCYL